MTNKELVAERRRTLKKYIVNYMGGKCYRCGWREHQSGLVPHHVDPAKKSFALGGAGKTLKWETLQEECKKCILLCQNCHVVIHAIKDQFYFNEENIPDYGEWEDPTRKRLRPKNYCTDCNAIIGFYAARCRPCTGRMNASRGHKIEWPNLETLQVMVKDSSYVQVARQLGVSDNAVRKRIKTYTKYSL